MSREEGRAFDVDWPEMFDLFSDIDDEPGKPGAIIRQIVFRKSLITR